MTPRDRLWRGSQFFRTPRGVRNKGSIIQKTLIQDAFAQFSKYRVDTSQVRQRLQGRSRGKVDYSTVPQEGLRIKG